MLKPVSFIGELLYPARCPLCDEVLPQGHSGFCRYCRGKVRYVEPPRCLRCGKHLESREKEYCADCGKRPHKFTGGRALYEYQSIAPALYRFKYQGRRAYAAFFAEELEFFLGDYLRRIKPDALIPVPMYSARQRRRGYNQAALLARALGEKMQIPVYENLIKRIKNTNALKTQNPEERLNNLKKAFILCGNGVKLKSVVIVDDIYTTGSTMDALCQVLLEESERKIYFITLAIGEG